jgi:hypothetical protein
LSRTIDDRYATAQEFSDALERAARALGFVGSVQDVSQCLESLMGVDLSQQRDAVRAWLARSEPSHERIKPALTSSVVTQVERGSRSELFQGSSDRPSTADRTGPSSSLMKPVVQAGASASQPAANRISAVPGEVSSVSSAVIGVPGGYAATGTRVAAPRAKRPVLFSRVALLVLAALAVLGGVAWGARTYRVRAAQLAAAPASGAMERPVGGSAEPEGAAVTTSVATPNSTAASAAAASSAAASSAAASSGATPEASASAVRGRGPVRGRPFLPPRSSAAAAKPAVSAPVAASAAPAPAALPDDLSHNPYR